MWGERGSTSATLAAASTTLTSESLARGSASTPKNITIRRPGICNDESAPSATPMAACSP